MKSLLHNHYESYNTWKCNMVGNSNNSTHVVLKIPSQIGILTKMQTFYILISYNIYRRNFDPIFCLFFLKKAGHRTVYQLRHINMSYFLHLLVCMDSNHWCHPL